MAGNQLLSRAVVFSSRIGWIGLCIDGATMTRLSFGRRSPSDVIVALADGGCEVSEPNRFEKQLIRRLQAFAHGERDDFLDLQVDQSGLTTFQKRVIHHCRRIDYGSTASYAELAARAGSAGAARAVGNVMARNRVPIIVPCHRVVGSGGRLGGYSAPDGIRMKRLLLALERSI